MPSSSNTPEANWYLNKTTSFVLIFQAVLTALFVAFIKYPAEADSRVLQNSITPLRGGFDHHDLQSSTAELVYVTLLIGVFGHQSFVDAGKSNLPAAFLLYAMCVQWAILCHGFLNAEDVYNVSISINILVDAHISIISVTIALSFLQKHCSTLQMLVSMIFQTPLQAFLSYLYQTLLQTNDKGGAVICHFFGATFGLILFFVLNIKTRNKKIKKVSYEKGSDCKKTIGSFLLLVFMLAVPYSKSSNDARRRAVLNSILALTSSITVGHSISSLAHPEKLFSAVTAYNGLLGCAVAISSVSLFTIEVYGAILIGCISTFVYIALEALLARRRNSINEKLLHAEILFIRHGVCGLIGGLLVVLISGIASPEFGYYGYSLYRLFPARAPIENTEELFEIQNYLSIQAGLGRSALEQACFQLLGIGVTVVISIVGGSLTGLLLHLPFFKTTEFHCSSDEDSSSIADETYRA